MSLTPSTPPKSHWWTMSSQWSYSCCVLVFMPDCSSLKETPSAQLRLSDQTITAVQVLTPVTWGFTFANHRLSFQLSMLTLLYCRSIPDAATLQMQPQCSSQWDELPNCTDTPIVRLAASRTACNGVVAAPVCPNVSVAAFPSRSIYKRGVEMLFSRGFETTASVFCTSLPIWITVYLYRASSEAEAMNVSLTLLFL